MCDHILHYLVPIHDTSVIITCIGVEVSEHGAFALGSRASITCSSDFGVQSVNWLRNGQVVSSTEGSMGELTIQTVTKSDHGNDYTCRTNAPFGVQEHNIVVQVEGTRYYIWLINPIANQSLILTFFQLILKILYLF